MHDVVVRGFAAECAHRSEPRIGVAVGASRAERGATGDQFRQHGHGLDAAGLRDPDESVSVEVVAEQDALVFGLGVEEARAAEVDEVGLVDRLEPEREPFRGERREDRLPVGLRAEGVAPERALSARTGRDRVSRSSSACRHETDAS